MEFSWGLFAEQFARTFTFWWVIVPSILLGLIVGAIPGFSAANTIIILLPLTLAMDPEIGMIFMVALYASSRLGDEAEQNRWDNDPPEGERAGELLGEQPPRKLHLRTSPS